MKRRFRVGVLVGTIASVILIVVIAVFVLPVLILGIIFAPPWQGMSEVVRDFGRNQEELMIVRDYLVGLGYEFITIRPNRETGPQISDPRADAAVDTLFERGYRIISKRANGLVFTRWSNTDRAVGVVYSMDGNAVGEDVLNFLTQIEPLDEEGWFFFVDDFNEWRVRNAIRN